MTDVPGYTALEWGVKRGWRAYVMGLSDGRFDVEGGVTLEPQSARWPASEPPGGTAAVVKFRGSLTAQGHYGMVLGHVTDPWIEYSDDHDDHGDHGGEDATTDERAACAATSGVITVVRWPGRAERIPLVTFTGDPAAGPVSTYLTREGTEVFGGVYREGTEMDPVQLVTGRPDGDIS